MDNQTKNTKELPLLQLHTQDTATEPHACALSHDIPLATLLATQRALLSLSSRAFQDLPRSLHSSPPLALSLSLRHRVYLCSDCSRPRSMGGQVTLHAL